MRQPLAHWTSVFGGLRRLLSPLNQLREKTMKVKLCVLLIGLTVLIAAVTATAKLINNHNSSQFDATATIEPIATAQAGDETSSDIKVVLLTLRSEGFDPAEMQLPEGEYLLIVRNRTGLDEVDVRLAREDGQHLGQSKVRSRQKDWTQRLKLTPGTYLLTEINHPDWTLRVVVDK
jgi:hypothetical protein